MLRSLFSKIRPFLGLLRDAFKDVIDDLRAPDRDDFSFPEGRDALGWTPEQRAKSGNHYNPLTTGDDVA